MFFYLKIFTNETDKNTIQQYCDNKKGKGWGDKAVVEWLFHISLDNFSIAFKWSKITYGENRYNYFEFGMADSGYMYLDFDTMADRELKESSSHDDCLTNDGGESLFDITLTFVARDMKKMFKGISKTMDDIFE